MAKINILSDEVRNRIKAGEVIDRPYSAVKEMVENSIDAGATEIEIRIERGGKDLIQITDNGCGIEKDDMRAAFFAHATSKISSLEDIDNIHTLGFRGEALASISSISKVELISAVEGQEANKVFCDGEFIGKVEPTAAPKGTKITVTNFFFNTPVRYKFMRSDKKEESDITSYVTRFILCRPEISFKYYVDGKLTLQSYGGGLDEALAQVYGANILGNCFKISADRNDIKIHGFIGNQNFSKPNKTYETLFLNGRYINNTIIQSAISNAYGAYLMKRNYPFYVLFIEMGCDLVDVNVHPNKTDVRFADNQLVYGTVYKVISLILDGSAKAAEYVVEDNNTAVPSAVQTSLYSAEFKQEEKVYDSDFSGVVGIEKYVKQPTQKKEDNNKPTQDFDYAPYENYVVNSPQLRGDTLEGFFGKDTKANGADELSFCSGLHDPFKINEKEQFEKKAKADQEKILYKQCKWCGTLFNTYLMYE
ncbi:MAG: DNA mismatch repair endonuclease MutL, partial [Clostridia bacterium]|nr:DNA mismatch repair endonuclease MutL [Clostridia bacterium]